MGTAAAAGLEEYRRFFELGANLFFTASRTLVLEEINPAWAELVGASPLTAAFATAIFRVYVAYNVAFGLLGMFVAATAGTGTAATTTAAASPCGWPALA